MTAFLPPSPAHAVGQRGPQGRAPNPNPILGAGPAGARAWLANAARLPLNSVGSMFQTWLTAEYGAPVGDVSVTSQPEGTVVAPVLDTTRLTVLE